MWRTPRVAVELLDRDVYAIGEAARLLGLHPSTARRWLDGFEQRGTRYRPVVRVEPTGSEIVTWGEFVELGYLREYRSKDISLQKLRPAVDRLREELDVIYPLAHARPYVDRQTHELLIEIQNETKLDRRLYMVVSKGGQLVLTPPAESFLEKVEFIGDGAARFKPAGPESPVLIDPTLSFGNPQVSGIKTEAIVELFLAREPVEVIADGFEIPVSDVEAAIRFELETLTQSAA
jgi:uncharacterized protein (DUF433 family)